MKRQITLLTIFSIAIFSCAHQKPIYVKTTPRSMVYEIYTPTWEHEVRNGLKFKIAVLKDQKSIKFTASQNSILTLQVTDKIIKNIQLPRKTHGTIHIKKTGKKDFTFYCIVSEQPFKRKGELGPEVELWNSRGFKTTLLSKGVKFILTKNHALDLRKVSLSICSIKNKSKAVKKCHDITTKFNTSCKVTKALASPPNAEIEIKISDRSYTTKGVALLTPPPQKFIKWQNSYPQSTITTNKTFITTTTDDKLAIIEIMNEKKFITKKLIQKNFSPSQTAAAIAEAVALRTKIAVSANTDKTVPWDAEIQNTFFTSSDKKAQKTADKAFESSKNLVLYKRGEVPNNIFLCQSNGGFAKGLAENTLYSYFLDGPVLPRIKINLQKEPMLKKWLASPPPSWEEKITGKWNAPHRWIKMYFTDEISHLFPEIEKPIDISAIKRDQSGRIISLQITGTSGKTILSGYDNIINTLKKLPSTLFYVHALKNTQKKPWLFIFIGAGSGRGIGLSTEGAKGMAENDFTFIEILRHYYKGIEVIDITKSRIK